MSDFKTYLQEKSLSRLYKHISEHDTGTISAYRGKKFKVENGKEIPKFSNEKYTKKENQQRNRSLLAKLQRLGYGVISVKGSYIENFNSPDATEVGEHTFFVIDLKDTGKLFNDLKKLGEQFNQDSILFIEKGGEKAILYGTNSVKKDAYPGYGKSKILKNRKLGSSGEFFTKVGNSPFMFEDTILEEIVNPDTRMGKWGLKIVAEEHWSDINVDGIEGLY
jgi:hypothetical protein